MKLIQLRPATSAAASWTSEALDLGDESVYGIEVYFSGSNVAGSLLLQGAVGDSTGAVATAAWQDLGNAVSITSSVGELFYTNGGAYRFVRVVWTYASGTGNMVVNTIIKQTPRQ